LNEKLTSCLDYLFYGKCKNCNVFVDFFQVFCSRVEANVQDAFILSTMFFWFVAMYHFISKLFVTFTC